MGARSLLEHGSNNTKVVLINPCKGHMLKNWTWWLLWILSNSEYSANLWFLHSSNCPPVGHNLRPGSFSWSCPMGVAALVLFPASNRTTHPFQNDMVKHNLDTDTDSYRDGVFTDTYLKHQQYVPTAKTPPSFFSTLTD